MRTVPNQGPGQGTELHLSCLENIFGYLTPIYIVTASTLPRYIGLRLGLDHFGVTIGFTESVKLSQ